MNWTEVNLARKEAREGGLQCFWSFLKQMGAQCEIEREREVWESEMEGNSEGAGGRLLP